jgi:hypothetical protein
MRGTTRVWFGTALECAQCVRVCVAPCRGWPTRTPPEVPRLRGSADSEKYQSCWVPHLYWVARRAILVPFVLIHRRCPSRASYERDLPSLSCAPTAVVQRQGRRGSTVQRLYRWESLAHGLKKKDAARADPHEALALVRPVLNDCQRADDKVWPRQVPFRLEVGDKGKRLECFAEPHLVS